MSLKEYKKKRDFKSTDEPPDSVKDASTRMNFCVQKHDASHLHYDFRLEYRGILLSWAVPKGPSLNPQNKRLAIKVEDHPLDYQYFEGIIPKGNYGAGTVEIWDHGTFTMPEATGRKEIEKKLKEGLKKGHFAVILDGERLKGEFIFQKLKKDDEDRSWLLIKKPDEYQETGERIKKTSPDSKITNKKIPEFIAPMLATLVDKPFDHDDWLFEVKWDGFRALAFVDQGKVELKSRNKLLFNEKFPSIVKNLQKIKGSVILDGEIVVVDQKGKSHFQLIQNFKEGSNVLCYYVFDILYKDHEDLMEKPLIERKEILRKFLKHWDLSLIRFSDHILKDGKRFFKAAAKEHLEGIIGKKITSSYQPKRSHDWVKIKTSLRQEVVICGFTEPQGSRKKFGALIVGLYDQDKKLQFAGHVGGGFNAALLEEVYDRLTPLIQKKCPFENLPKSKMPATWVKPKLIGEVAFAEWTHDNMMRQPIFQGLRMDKDAKTVNKEVPEAAPADDKNEKLKKIKGLSLTHLEKVYWPKEKYTKGDLIAYYEAVGPMILPYLKNRPIMLHRYPDGIEGKDFYQKDINFSHPDWIKTFPVQHEGKEDHYLLIGDLRSLLYAVNLGSIDLHPFMSQITSLDHPDYCVIDLDPHDISFDKVIETAQIFHEILEKIHVKHVCKTSGGKGLHILIPLHAKYTYEQSRQFAEIICHIIHKKIPETTSMERSPEKRPQKIYLDCLQNRVAQSIVAPYAVRPRSKAMVSTPLLWEEVNKDLDITAYTIESVPKRLKKIGDIFKPVLGPGINIEKSLDSINKLFATF